MDMKDTYDLHAHIREIRDKLDGKSTEQKHETETLDRETKCPEGETKPTANETNASAHDTEPPSRDTAAKRAEYAEIYNAEPGKVPSLTEIASGIPQSPNYAHTFLGTPPGFVETFPGTLEPTPEKAVEIRDTYRGGLANDGHAALRDFLSKKLDEARAERDAAIKERDLLQDMLANAPQELVKIDVATKRDAIIPMTVTSPTPGGTAADRRKTFLTGIKRLVEYWQRENRDTPEKRIEGVAFEILALIDGSSGVNDFTPYTLTDDCGVEITNGDELHDEFAQMEDVR